MSRSAMTSDSSPFPERTSFFVQRMLVRGGDGRGGGGGQRLADGGVCIFVKFTQSITFESIIW